MTSGRGVPLSGRAAVTRVRDLLAGHAESREDHAWRGRADFSRDLGPARMAHDTQSVTRILYERLTDEDVAEVERRAADASGLDPIPSAAEDLPTRRYLILNYGMWFGIKGVAERTRLIFAEPPDDVHAMARGPLAAAGGLYEADMVVNAVRSGGVAIEEVGEALDFGCSSGRVLRVLSATYPELRWSGCDPNERAIEWVSESLGQARFFVNPQAPPLPIPEGSLGLAYAVSIWSHFAPELGLRWFDEMHRVLRPGGLLVFTSHGEQSISYYVERGARSVEQAASILQALYRRGWWYAAEFGQTGDAGVVNPDWGTAFITPEWVLSKLCPRWRVVEFAAGRNQLNQDVYVLQRP